MIPPNDVIEEVFKVIKRYETHTDERVTSKSGVYKASALPDPIWRIRWAILTLVIYDVKERANWREAVLALQAAWANLEKYIEDAYVDRIESGLQHQVDSERHETAKNWIKAINQKWLDAFDVFEQIMVQLIPDLAAERDEEIIKGLNNFRRSLASARKQS